MTALAYALFSLDISKMGAIMDDHGRAGELASAAWTDSLPKPEDLQRWRAEIGRIQRQLLEGNENLKRFVGKIDRGFHEKQLYAGPARVKVRGDLPGFLQFGPFRPASDGTPPKHNAAVRFSNGRGCPFDDGSPDVRGIAIKLIDQKGEPWDILATNKQTFARNPEQFMKFAAADAIAQTAGDQTTPKLVTVFGLSVDLNGIPDELAFVIREIFAGRFNPVEAARIAIALTAVLRPPKSLVTESYDGGTFKTPDGVLAKIIFIPKGDARPIDVDQNNPNYLAVEIQQQLARNHRVEFTMSIKIFTGKGNPTDASDPWEPSKEHEVADLEVVGHFGRRIGEFQEAISKMAFNPATGFEPAVMSHARKAIYEKSAKNRGAITQEEAVATIRRYFHDSNE